VTFGIATASTGIPMDSEIFRLDEELADLVAELELGIDYYTSLLQLRRELDEWDNLTE
jgi:hypothetical protein